MLYRDNLACVSQQPYRLSGSSRNIILFFVIFVRVILPTTELKLPSQVVVLTNPKAHGTRSLNSPSPHTVLTPSARHFHYTLMVSPPYLGVLP